MPSDSLPPNSPPAASPAPALLQQRPPLRAPTPVLAWVLAAAVVLAVVAALLVFARHPATAPKSLLPLDPYAASLTVSNLAMSESTSLSGGKSTFIDGSVRNTGPHTVTAATVQVLFRNDQGMPPQVETLPLTFIRMRDPYIDIEPISAAPLRPGDEREFRLILENIGANWNQNLPEIHVVRVNAH